MRSLRARLLVWTVGGMALLLAVFGVGVYAVIDRALVGGFEGALAAAARAIAASVKQEDGKVEIEFNEEDMPEFHRPLRPDYFEFWGRDGSVLKRSTSLGRGDLARSDGPLGTPVFRPAALPDGRPGKVVVLVFEPRSDEGDQHDEDEDRAKDPGPKPDRPSKKDADARDRDRPQKPRPEPAIVTLLVARETAALDANLALVRWILVGAGAGTVALTLLVAAVVVRQGLRPLDALAARIAAIREDNLAATIPVDRMPAEMVPIGRRLNDLLGRIEEAFRRERAFTADAAHELRTPLAGMRSTLEVALSRERKSADYQESARECLDIVRHMQAMVDALLMLARLEGGQVALRPETVGLAEFVEALWRPLADGVAARRMTVARRLPAHLACSADRQTLGLILSNLLENAARYTNDGGRIDVVAAATGDGVELVISNTGCRLAPEEAAHVFDRLWRGDTARTDTGVHCGLGLALVQRAAAAVGGAVSVRVEGDVFTVRLLLPAAMK